MNKCNIFYWILQCLPNLHCNDFVSNYFLTRRVLSFDTLSKIHSEFKRVANKNKTPWVWRSCSLACKKGRIVLLFFGLSACVLYNGNDDTIHTFDYSSSRRSRIVESAVQWTIRLVAGVSTRTFISQPVRSTPTSTTPSLSNPVRLTHFTSVSPLHSLSLSPWRTIGYQFHATPVNPRRKGESSVEIND